MRAGTVQWDRSSWNKVLAQSVTDGKYQTTLQLFQQMQQEGMIPDKYTFMPVLKACASLQAPDEGRRIHAQISQHACKSDVFVGCSLIDMYAKCGSVEDAWSVFHDMPVHDLAAWNAMVQCFAKYDKGERSLQLFKQMQAQGFMPDRGTFLGALNACASLGALEEGKNIHAQVVQSGHRSDIFVLKGLLDMYAKCGSIENVQRVFNEMWNSFHRVATTNVLVWNAMIQGCVKSGQGQKALDLAHRMQGRGVVHNNFTLVALVNACASMKALETGKEIHRQIIDRGFDTEGFVASSLADMYAKCGSIEDARAVFDKMPAPDVVAWTTMICGYVKCGLGLEALALYVQMESKRVQPNRITFLGVLNACASAGALESGREIHSEIIQSGLETDNFVGNALVDMYAKCGSMDEAWKVFTDMPTRDAVAWTAMLSGYAMVGQAKEALQMFERMCHEDVQVDGITFVCLISACSHVGLVDEGRHYFETMSPIYGIQPTVDHYACLVDLLGRAGHLHGAEHVIKMMPCIPNLSVWMALLAACRVHDNLDIGENVAQRIFELDLRNPAGYVMLSNIYAAAGKWDRRASVQQMRAANAVKKTPGSTWIEVNRKVHSFTANNQKHPQMLQIHEELKRLMNKITEEGYVPDTRFDLHDVGEEEKVVQLGHHSEKLAIAFGLISTPPGTPIRIMKNLRVCGDCHTATKLISKVVERDIFVRDAQRFHHFSAGVCSCNEYW